jgi:hypothetical protein
MEDTDKFSALLWPYGKDATRMNGFKAPSKQIPQPRQDKQKTLTQTKEEEIRGLHLFRLLEMFKKPRGSITGLEQPGHGGESSQQLVLGY